MIYLQNCCCCIDLRIGTIIIAILDIIMDIVFGFIIAVSGESGRPDLGHKLFIIFMVIHLVSALLLLPGAAKLRPKYMLCYILISMVKIVLMIILIISDILLEIWYVVLILYAVMFFLGLYFWLVVYSFYAALGGTVFL